MSEHLSRASKTVGLREVISVAAQELYLSEGIEGVTMRKVARRVGVSAPALYRYFSNKDELLNEIVIEGLRILEEYLKPALAAETPYQRLVTLADNYLSFTLEQPRYFDFAFLVPSPFVRRFRDEVARPDWTTFRMAIDQVAACMEQGVFRREDPLETSITLWAEVHGLVILFRTGRFGPDGEEFRGIYRRAIRRVLRGFMAEPLDETPLENESGD
jgi:AcrR family transcriptional regulator